MAKKASGSRYPGLVSLALAGWLACAALFAQPSPTLRGEWTATTEPSRVYRGKWIGQALAGQPNAAHGSWTLSGEGGKAILSGTWSARKAGRQLQGTWSAQDQYGRSVAGTWQAETPELSSLSLEQMLQVSLQRVVSGTFRSGRLRGNWWIRAFSAPPGSG